jgi:transcription elongation factor GreA
MKNKTITLNSKVTLSCNNIVKTYQIARSEELDTSTVKISNQSPLGKLLLESKVNDTIKVTTPGGITEYKVVSVDT